MRNIHSRLGSLVTCGALAANLVLATAAMLPMTGPSLALPKTCVIRNYYDNAELDTQVGMRSGCPGHAKWGKITKFVEVEKVDLEPGGVGGPGGPGGLPCEFLGGEATGLKCNNLPQLRN